MYFATFFQPSAIDPKNRIVEVCGDRGTIILDGRQHAGTHHAIAANTCRERKFVAYRLHKGESLNRVARSSEIYRVSPSP